MILEMMDSIFYFFKVDILKGIIMYFIDKNFIVNVVIIIVCCVFEIINMNWWGEKLESLIEFVKKNEF